MKKVRVILLTFMLLGLAVAASGCGPASKSERAIADDLAEVDECIQEFDMEITDWTVDKRQTNSEDKTDYIWISIEADCDFFSYTADYTAEYVLYNDGWALENYTRVDYQYDRFDTVSEDIVARDLAEQEYRFSDLNLQVVGQTVYERETDPERKTDVISIWVDFDCKECSVSVNYIATYWLDSDGWHYEGASFKDFDYVGKSSILQQEVVDSAVKRCIDRTYGDFQNITFDRRVERENAVDFYYTGHKAIPHLDVTGEFCLTYVYVLSPEDGIRGWKLQPFEDGRVAALETDLVGTWRYRDDDMELTVDILSAEVTIDDSEGYVSCDCDCTYSMINLPVYWYETHKTGSGWSAKYTFEFKSGRRDFTQAKPIHINLGWEQEDLLEEENSLYNIGKLFDFPVKNERYYGGEVTAKMDFRYSREKDDSDYYLYRYKLYLEYDSWDEENRIKYYILTKDEAQN